MFKHKIKFGLILIIFGLLVVGAQYSARAVTADTILEIRDRCNAGVQCTAPVENETQRESALGHNYGEEFSVDIYIKNPSQQKIISAQTWLEYDKAKLEVVKIDTSNSAFDFVAPGENQFDQTKGLIKIGRSSIGTQTNVPELFVANISFKVITKYQGKAVLKFYDYQLSESGHTSVRVMEDNFPVNVLENAPKAFAISVNQAGAVSTGGQNLETTNTQGQNSALSTANRPTGFKATTGNGYIFMVWDKSKDTKIKGYNLYYSTTSGRYLQRRPLGNVNQYEMGNLENGKIYYLSITAYDYTDRETDYSDEIRITVGDPNSSSSPILISRDEYLTQVPAQPQNGPAMLLVIFGIALASSFTFLKFKKLMTINN